MIEFLLGIIQGLTEFLPVSSSGHQAFYTYVAGSFFGDIDLMIWTHLGTVVAILIYYFKDFKALIKLKFKTFSKLIQLFAVALLPVFIIGVFFKSFVGLLFSYFLVVPIGFLFTAFVLLVSQRSLIKNEVGLLNKSASSWEDLENITFKTALIMGLAQCLAVVPGVSRSGLTISSGLLLKQPFHRAAFFSFMMSVPLILGAGLLLVLSKGVDSVSWIAFLASVLSGYLGLYLVNKYLRAKKWSVFAYYLFVASFVSFVVAFISQ